MLAGKLFKIPVMGNHVHGYIASFDDITELSKVMLAPKEGGEPKNLVHLSLLWRSKLSPIFQIPDLAPNNGELAALVAYAIAFPDDFIAVVDTYDVKRYPSHMNSAVTLWPVTLPNTLSHNEYR